MLYNGGFHVSLQNSKYLALDKLRKLIYCDWENKGWEIKERIDEGMEVRRVDNFT